MEEALKMCLEAKEQLQTEAASIRQALDNAQDPSVPAPDTSSITTLGVKVTKKGKVLQTLSEIQKGQLLQKQMDERLAKQSDYDNAYGLILKSFSNADSTLVARLEAAWRKVHLETPDVTRAAFDGSPIANTIRDQIPLPKVKPSIDGIRVITFKGKFLDSSEYGKLSEFLDRNPIKPIWYAPTDAIKDGKVQPLDHPTETFLLKNWAHPKKVSLLNEGDRQKIAWKWLIISHNNMHPTSRVHLNKKLTVNYGVRAKLGLRPADTGRHSSPAPLITKEELIESLSKEFRRALAQPDQPEKAESATGFITIREEYLGNMFTITGNLLATLTRGEVLYDKAHFKCLKSGSEQLTDTLNHWGQLFCDMVDSHAVPSSLLAPVINRVDRPPSRGRRGISTDSSMSNRSLGHIRTCSKSPAPQGTLTCWNCHEPVEKDTLCPCFAKEKEWERLEEARMGEAFYTCSLCGKALEGPNQHCLNAECKSALLAGIPPNRTGWDPKGTPTEDEPPESFDLDGRQWFREDVDFLDIKEGQVFLTMTRFGAAYVSIDGKPLSDKPKSEKSKGKTPVRPVPQEEKGESSKGAKPNKPKGKTGATPEKPKSPISEENPLKVKGEPKSKALSDEQRKALRTYFKLVDGQIPKEEWSVMDNKARAKAMKDRSIPRWASTAVLKRSSALQDILQGKLTAQSRPEGLGKLPVATHATGQALEAWTKLKNDFKGVSLFHNPSTGREKALKKRFDQLVLDYGEQKCFPKPRSNPERQGRTGSRRGGSSQSGGLENLLPIAKLFGEISRAMRP